MRKASYDNDEVVRVNNSLVPGVRYDTLGNKLVSAAGRVCSEIRAAGATSAQTQKPKLGGAIPGSKGLLPGGGGSRLLRTRGGMYMGTPCSCRWRESSGTVSARDRVSFRRCCKGRDWPTSCRTTWVVLPWHDFEGIGYHSS